MRVNEEGDLTYSIPGVDEAGNPVDVPICAMHTFIVMVISNGNYSVENAERIIKK